MPEHRIIEGASARLDRYYALSVSEEHGGDLLIRELYEYPARGEDDGREYAYTLTIPATYAPAFLAYLARKAQGDQSSGHPHPRPELAPLFQRLAKQGALAPTETATARQNLETIIAWLKQANIPYEEHVWSF